MTLMETVNLRNENQWSVCIYTYILHAHNIYIHTYAKTNAGICFVGLYMFPVFYIFISLFSQ